MLDFTDQPYQFFPPRPNSLVISLTQLLNRKRVLPGPKHRVERIELRNADRVLSIREAGARCLFLPNHPTHSDPQMMLEVQRRLRMNAYTMAAYDVFLRGKLQCWMMQRIGCFSIDREGSDSQAMKTAVDILVKGDKALTIFPEGNVLLMNDRVTPFLGGAAFIGMRAQKKLGPDKPIFAVPVSLKYSLMNDCREAMTQAITKLEVNVGIPQSSLPIRSRLREIGEELLSRNLRQRGYLSPGRPVHEELDELLEVSAMQIISKLEEKIQIPASDEPPLERIRKIRSAIHQIRIDEKKQIDHRVASSWADEAILAVRILSYAGEYVKESPTLDRCGETLEKLQEDLQETIIPPIGDRCAYVHFGEPISLADQLSAVKKDSRGALTMLTRKFEDSVQMGINEINETNSLPGSQRFEI